MHDDPNLLGGNTRVIEIPEDLVHRDVYEYILYIAEVVGIRPNGVHMLPHIYEDVIDAILKIRNGDGLNIVHGGYFTYPADSTIQSHNLSSRAHLNLKLDAGEIQHINNDLISVVDVPGETPLDGGKIGEPVTDNQDIIDHNRDEYAHAFMVADGQIFDGKVIMPETTVEQHNDHTDAHGVLIIDGNIELDEKDH